VIGFVAVVDKTEKGVGGEALSDRLLDANCLMGLVGAAAIGARQRDTSTRTGTGRPKGLKLGNCRAGEACS
jgi:hypothetical protein